MLIVFSDNSNYRFEEDKDKCEAIAQFGLKDLGALNLAFEKAKSASTPFIPH